MPHSVLREYQYMKLKAAAKPPAGILHLEFAFSSETSGQLLPGKNTGDVSLIQKVLPFDAIQTNLVVSLGSKGKATPEQYRRAGGAAAKKILAAMIPEAVLDCDTIDPASLPALLEGLLLGAFTFQRYKSDREPAAVPTLTLTGRSIPALQALADHVSIVCAAANLSRDWSHEPANVINPLTLAKRIEAACHTSGLKCNIIDEQQLAVMGAGGILNVGGGSKTPPRLIVVEYPGRKDAIGSKPVVLVGKALTFDSGGYSLKNLTDIQGMKYDKCGGISVFAVLLAAAELKLPMRLVGVIGAAENMISGQAYRPDDIIRMMSGKTVEIITTDAEGRLVLGDCLTYAQKNYQPSTLIDIATLTGGIVVALGTIRAGLFSTDDGLAGKLFQAGEDVYERLWRMPLDDEYSKNIASDDADIKNSGGREGHPVYGGVFLKEFIDEDIPWAHLDIAGVDSIAKDMPYCPRGSTGFGVRLLLRYLESLVSPG